MDFYFSRFEHRRPPEPLSTPRWVRMIWQVLAVAALVLGANYIYWRWTASLNTDALWYAIPVSYTHLNEPGCFSDFAKRNL